MKRHLSCLLFVCLFFLSFPLLLLLMLGSLHLSHTLQGPIPHHLLPHSGVRRLSEVREDEDRTSIGCKF